MRRRHRSAKGAVRFVDNTNGALEGRWNVPRRFGPHPDRRMTKVCALTLGLTTMAVVVLLTVTPATAVPGPIYSLAIDPETPTVLFAGGANGVFKSADGGVTWSAAPIASATRLGGRFLNGTPG